MKIYTIKEHDKLLEYIEENITPKEKEKKQSGEVFTPLSIVNEMLDKLPKKIWKDHSLKWLDPSVGIGNFPICIYLRLMEGLEKWQKNEEKRRKHILENMIYMVEINSESIKILKNIFCNNEYKLNIFPNSYFKYMKKGFNVIIGNPPYNEGGTGRTSGSRQPFWPKFAEYSMTILDDTKESYMMFIHPCGWRKPYSEDKSKNIGLLFKQLCENGSLLYIKMTDEIIPHFPPVDIYLYSNKKHKQTIVDSTLYGVSFKNQKVDLSRLVFDKIRFIPSLLNNQIVNIINKAFKKRNDNPFYNVEYSGHFIANKKMLKNKKKGTPFTFYYEKNKYVEVYNDKVNLKDDYINKPKIIMTFNGSFPVGTLSPVYYKNPIGSSTYTMYYLTDGNQQEIDKHIRFFDSKLVFFLMLITQYSPAPRNKNDHKILNSIQIPNLPKNPTDGDIYKYFGITKPEQKIIENVTSFKRKEKKKDLKKKSIKSKKTKKSKKI